MFFEVGVHKAGKIAVLDLDFTRIDGFFKAINIQSDRGD
jgi:hypothetical protein